MWGDPLPWCRAVVLPGSSPPTARVDGRSPKIQYTQSHGEENSWHALRRTSISTHYMLGRNKNRVPRVLKLLEGVARVLKVLKPLKVAL